MKITRKFNLGRISEDLKYESTEIEMSGENVEEIIKKIDAAWLVYKTAIMEGKVK